MGERSADFKDTEVVRLQFGGRFLNHQWKEQSLDIAFNQYGRICKEQIAVSKLHVLLQEIPRFFGRVTVEGREIQDIRGLGGSRDGGTSEVANRLKPALIVDMRGVRRNHQLAGERRGFGAINL